MTEQEWLTCADTLPMIRSAETMGHWTPRRALLFAAGCLGRIRDLLVDERSRTAVDTAERFADGLATELELTAASREGEAAMRVRSSDCDARRNTSRHWKAWAMHNAAGAACKISQRDGFAASHAAANAAAASFAADRLRALPARERTVAAAIAAMRATFGAERKSQCDLLRHIIGNPFRPYRGPGSWPASVASLAQSFSDQQPVHFALHDALLESGHADLAEHFNEADHPKGCWAIDLILGKS